MPATKGTRSRRIDRKETTTIYCRKCMLSKKEADFFSATDRILDSNGFMSVCKECCDDLYKMHFAQEKSLERAILRTCKSLNIAYVPNSVQAVRTILEKTPDRYASIFGLYKRSVSSMKNLNATGALTFEEPARNVSLIEPLTEDDEDFDVQEFWGRGLTQDDYIFLERELSEWKQTHKCDNKAELTLLKEIVYKQWEIRHAREEGKSAESAIKALQDLMKTASVDPAKSNLANSGKNMDSFGMWIKDIERTTPAEWLGERGDVFKDVDGMEKYCEDYIRRPIKNFLSGSRDFNIDENSEISDEDFSDFYDDAIEGS